MKSGMPSETFRYLYYNIVGEMMSSICESNDNICVNTMFGEDRIHIGLWKKFEEYKRKASGHMTRGRLDRHKLASCICGAIVEAQPLIGYKGAKIPKNANEMLAIHAGIAVIKCYMIYDYCYNAIISPDDRQEMLRYLKDNFEMKFPALNENICDTLAYHKSIANALYRCHSECQVLKRECFRYDIWAYAKIFYHLEVYNRKKFNEACEKYIEQKDKGLL